jgi:hypothetical protein
MPSEAVVVVGAFELEPLFGVPTIDTGVVADVGAEVISDGSVISMPSEAVVVVVEFELEPLFWVSAIGNGVREELGICSIAKF